MNTTLHWTRSHNRSSGGVIKDTHLNLVWAYFSRTAESEDFCDDTWHAWSSTIHPFKSSLCAVAFCTTEATSEPIRSVNNERWMAAAATVDGKNRRSLYSRSANSARKLARNSTLVSVLLNAQKHRRRKVLLVGWVSSKSSAFSTILSIDSTCSRE